MPADPVELTFDGSHPISAYFPPEILETLAEAGVTTIDEAMAVLEEAGLMQQATDIVTQNPEVLEWYNGVFSGGAYESYRVLRRRRELVARRRLQLAGASSTPHSSAPTVRISSLSSTT